MSLRKKQLKNSKLYLILDREVLDNKALIAQTKRAVKAKIPIMQLRDKNSSSAEVIETARKIRSITKNKALFIINDRPDIAMLVKADGVHVGQDDMPVKDARKILGLKFIIGTSCQNIGHLKQAMKDGVDYVGFGSVFKTLTKPERNPMDLKLLASVIKVSKIPVFPIGGINLSNLGKVKMAGLNRAAICRCLLTSKKIEKDAKEILLQLSS